MTFTPLRPRRGPSRPGAARDSFALYLEEIGRHQLLGPDEEADLARRIRAGERTALEELVASNLRFVVSVARRYRHIGVPLHDLVTEGNLGLLEAARRFDERKGVRFTSYAIWWVRQAILCAIRRQTSFVRSADHPARSAVRQVSLDAPPGRDGWGSGASLGELLAGDPGGGDPGVGLDRAALRDELDASLTLLDERESVVVRLCFGLEDGEPIGLAEIGKRLGVSRERVRQIRERALARLRCGATRHRLESFHR